MVEEEGSLRRGRRGKWRILGVGGGGGWWCHLGFLDDNAEDIFSCSVRKTKSVCLYLRRKGCETERKKKEGVCSSNNKWKKRY